MIEIERDMLTVYEIIGERETEAAVRFARGMYMILGDSSRPRRYVRDEMVNLRQRIMEEFGVRIRIHIGRERHGTEH